MSTHPFKSSDSSGVYFLPPARLIAIETAAGKERLRLLKAEISAHADRDKALGQLGTDLGFPIWYGGNFDALFDCLTDSDWQPAKGHVLIIRGVAELRSTDPESFSTLIEVFRAAADARKEAGSPFWILLDTPARGIPPLPEA
jgi:RNAse (barnase) inhibitor barstar